MLHLRYTGSTMIPLECECITPDGFSGKSLGEIAALPVFHGNRQERLGDWFEVSGDSSDDVIHIEGETSRVKWIGAGMTRGTIRIAGGAGMHLGSEMRGGLIELSGNAGDWVGGEMRGGRIHVRGDAGHLVGAAYRGSRKGMRGGAILIEGNAGNEVGGSMRRGLIAIGGACGDFPGVSMIAGSVFLFGSCGLRPGADMKRGTLAFFNEMPPLLPSFRFDCEYQPAFVHLFLRQLRTWEFGPAAREFSGAYRRYSGDLVALGKGELLHWQGAATEGG